MTLGANPLKPIPSPLLVLIVAVHLLRLEELVGIGVGGEIGTHIALRGGGLLGEPLRRAGMQRLRDLWSDGAVGVELREYGTRRDLEYAAQLGRVLEAVLQQIAQLILGNLLRQWIQNLLHQQPQLLLLLVVLRADDLHQLSALMLVIDVLLKEEYQI